MEQIVIDIDEAGNVRIEGKGIVGPDCESLTADLESSLGTVESHVRKPEFRQARKVVRKAGA